MCDNTPMDAVTKGKLEEMEKLKAVMECMQRCVTRTEIADAVNKGDLEKIKKLLAVSNDIQNDKIVVFTFASSFEKFNIAKHVYEKGLMNSAPCFYKFEKWIQAGGGKKRFIGGSEMSDVVRLENLDAINNLLSESVEKTWNGNWMFRRACYYGAYTTANYLYSKGFTEHNGECEEFFKWLEDDMTRKITQVTL